MVFLETEKTLTIIRYYESKKLKRQRFGKNKLYIKWQS